MLRPLAIAVSVFIAGLGLFLSSWTSPAQTPIPPILGRNNTALFIVNSEPGFSNINLATAKALLEQHPHVEVHIASFEPLRPRIQRVTSYVQKNTGTGQGIEFHQINGLSLTSATVAAGQTADKVIHPPGRAGIDALCRDFQLYVSPWSVEDHLAMYEQMKQILAEVDPAVVILDTLLRPALDATRDQNRLHAFLVPNTLIDNFPDKQPWGAMLWKYPA